MTVQATELLRLPPARRADILYSAARSELEQQLWRAALGDDGEMASGPVCVSDAPAAGLQSLLSTLSTEVPSPSNHGEPSATARGQLIDETGPAALSPSSLGANVAHLDTIEEAAQRVGLPAAALASIIEAEAGKSRNGAWNCHSRNPRSSAAGLGQFLSGTWESEAERRGTWLNQIAASRGWLGGRGRVTAAARTELLGLRYDANASINAIADYARSNLDRLSRAGIDVGSSANEIARTAYLGHHLGPGDAVRFLKGRLDPARAGRLLAAQVGAADAGRRIAAAGDTVAAHKTWLLSYVGRRIRPERFSS